MELRVENYSKEIRGVSVLEGINLVANSGEIVGLAGINGSGKTMLLRAMAGLIKSKSGLISVDGKVVGRDMDFPARTGILIENPSFIPSRTGVDNLSLLLTLEGESNRAAAENAVASFGLDPADRRKFRKYSLGMRQRLGLAAAFMNNHELLLLDEPTNALDPSGVQLFMERLAEAKQRGALAIVASHDAAVLKGCCDVVYSMAEGHIIGKEQIS